MNETMLNANHVHLSLHVVTCGNVWARVVTMVSQGSLHAESESQNRTLEAHGEQDVLQLSRTSFAARAEAPALQNLQIAMSGYVVQEEKQPFEHFWTKFLKVLQNIARPNKSELGALLHSSA